MRKTVNNPKIFEGKTECPICGQEVELNPGRCECGARIKKVYKSKKNKKKVEKITWRYYI